MNILYYIWISIVISCQWCSYAYSENKSLPNVDEPNEQTKWVRSNQVKTVITKCHYTATLKHDQTKYNTLVLHKHSVVRDCKFTSYNAYYSCVFGLQYWRLLHISFQPSLFNVNMLVRCMSFRYRMETFNLAISY